MQYIARSKTLFGKLQTALGTPAVPTDTDVVAAMDLESSPEISSEETTYAGLASRAVETSITDKVRTASFSAYAPSAVAAGNTAVLFDWFEACGASQTVVATTSAAASNAVASYDALTMQYYKHDTAGTAKVVTMEDSNGTVDLDVTLGSRAKFTLNMRGEYDEAIQEGSGLTADFATQKSAIAQRLTKDNIVTAKLEAFDETAGAKNICFGSLNVSNLFGFALERYQHSCNTGHALTPEPGEVKLVILEEDAGADYNPETFLEAHHAFTLEWGNAAGKTQILSFTDMQLVSITDTTLGPWAGQELTFKNVGFSSYLIK